MNDTYDLIVIGAGSGGVAAARRAAAHGARVLIAEADRVGGTCVIRGCVPKKLMMYAAGYAQLLSEAVGFGWTGVSGRFEMARWADAKAHEIDRLEAIYRRMLADAGVELVDGRARLSGPGLVEVAGRSLRAGRVLIATGGAPARDALPGLELAMSSNEVLNLREVPASLLVIGGGYIAVEFASILAGLGAQVTLAFRDTLPLRGFDPDLRTRLAQALSTRGLTLAGGVALSELARGSGGGFELRRADASVLRAEAVLNATGRRPNTAGLGLAEAGVQLDARGAVAVDQDSCTTAPGIWAVGDVTNRVNLTPVAIAEGRAFADSEFGRRRVRVDHRTVASAVFTEPPIATVGLTEADAAREGPVDVYESDFRPMKSAFAGGAGRSYMKLVVDGLSDVVLGIHMIGTDAPEIVQSLAVALTCRATKADFDRTLAVHPTAAEEFVLMREPVRRHGTPPHGPTGTAPT
ncbi:glutathione-disulfide reductase [Azohydromonas caseinilytica]|uniref:Glutathione-disulfide reductase n=1 Tax=Azohydromonas caseinilytica TaxID=2728836 RepID=A0A848FJ23_9BURK|nr:glutathione-disulfide reductase [Azohydromonas caseinilytica]NML19136.1 glutathione-disulfide reductase [Azohydromonas caseinilytica]